MPLKRERGVTPHGPKIIGLYKAMGLTQKAFAEKAGIKVSTLRRIENGESCYPNATLLPIARALGVEPGELTIKPLPALPAKEPDAVYHQIGIIRDIDDQTDDTTMIQETIEQLVATTEIRYILTVPVAPGITVPLQVDERDLAPILLSLAKGALEPIAVKAVYLPPNTAQSLSPKAQADISPLFTSTPVDMPPGMGAIVGVPSGTAYPSPELVALPQNDGGLVIVRASEMEK